MSKIQVTFNGVFDVSDALMSELMEQDTFPTINSSIAQVSQFVLNGGSHHKYVFVYETPDAFAAVEAAIRNHIESNYPSITVESVGVFTDEIPQPVVTPVATDVAAGGGSQ